MDARSPSSPALTCFSFLKRQESNLATQQFPTSWVNWIVHSGDSGRCWSTRKAESCGPKLQLKVSVKWRRQKQHYHLLQGRTVRSPWPWPAAFSQTAGWTVTRLLFDIHQWQLRPYQIAGTWPNPIFFSFSFRSNLCRSVLQWFVFRLQNVCASYLCSYNTWVCGVQDYSSCMFR